VAIDVVKEYRAHAKRVLAEAQKHKDPDARAALLEIASRYAWLADWAEGETASH
jgi:hypothetical protein